uniref:Uncharacterized protein n=1 Tax=Myripristis murdjan TaxID=586833 RepID=A0A667ZNQ1_9TELE
MQDCKGSFSAPCPPVLMTVWMTFATWPLRSELSSLTRSSRQVQRTAREPASRISPTVRSDSCDDANKCRPEERQDHRNSAHTVSQRDGLTEHYYLWRYSWMGTTFLPHCVTSYE